MIAHNHPGFFPGGGEIFAYRMFLELKRNAAYTTLFLGATGKQNREPHPGTPFLAYEGREDEYLFWGDHFDYFQQSLRDSEFLYRDFANFLTLHRPSVIHFHHTLRLGVEALTVARRTLPDARIIYTLHDFIPMCHRDGQMIRVGTNALCERATPARCHECFPTISSARFKARELFIKAHFQHVDMFVSPSEFLAERYRQWGIPTDKISVIANGTPTPQRTLSQKKTLPRSNNQPVRFGYFGQISSYKGTMLLLKAAQELINDGFNNIELHIHGNIHFQSDDFKEEFESTIAKLAPRAQFHGVYPPEQISHLMHGIDWVVVPSIWWENAPLVISEALRHQKPVICSDIGGMAELIQHEVNGLHFRVGDMASLVDAMRRTMTEKGLQQRLIKQITQPLTIKECVQQYMHLYVQKKTMLDANIRSPAHA